MLGSHEEVVIRLNSIILLEFLSLPINRTSSFQKRCSLWWDTLTERKKAEIKNLIKTACLAQKLIVSVRSFRALFIHECNWTPDFDAMLHWARKMKHWAINPQGVNGAPEIYLEHKWLVYGLLRFISLPDFT